jgi:pyruvate kinase
MALYRNVYPVAHDPQGDAMEPVLMEGLRLLWRQGAIAAGDRVILTMGQNLGNQGGTNTMRLIKLGADGVPEHQTELDLR